MKQIIQKENITDSFIGQMEALDIFLRQNRGKGPPGGWFSPRGGQGLEPDIMQLPVMANISKNTLFNLSIYKFYSQQIFIHN